MIPSTIGRVPISALSQADAIVYDALVDESCLKLARPGVMLEYAGKRGGKPSPKQRDISLRLVELARSGMTMICVTHEMGFAQAVANRVIFMDQGQIVEQNGPKEFFSNPKSDRTKLFLSQILGH